MNDAAEVPFEFDAAFYDAIYGSRTAEWCGDPNPNLVSEMTDVSPGSALDVGCGDGSDAVWLARHRWNVTATDFSAIAIERNRRIPLDATVAERITWVQADITQWEPPRQYDLVSAHFMHLSLATRDGFFTRLAASVAPTGTLLVVGHHPSDVNVPDVKRSRPELLYTAEDVQRLLSTDEWHIVVADKRSRDVTDLQGRIATINDAILVARKMARPIHRTST